METEHPTLRPRTTFMVVTVALIVACVTIAAFFNRLYLVVPPLWYNTQDIACSLVDEKATIRLTEKQAGKVFDESEDRIAEDWRANLSIAILPAEKVSSLPGPERGFVRDKEHGPLELIIVGFDQKHVRVVLARHVGGFLWHKYHAVAADFMIDRSERVDRLLDLKQFTLPFIRTVKGVGYGSTKDAAHSVLGQPDAERITQAAGYTWEYYFDQNLAIEYKRTISRILDEVPNAIREGTSRNPLVRYRRGGDLLAR